MRGDGRFAEIIACQRERIARLREKAARCRKREKTAELEQEAADLERSIAATERMREEKERLQAANEAPFTALGLSSGATSEDVRRAYKQRAKSAHPDGGGSAAQFRTLRRHYERAMRSLGAEEKGGA